MVLIRRIITLLLGSALVARAATLLKNRSGPQRTSPAPAPHRPLAVVPSPTPEPVTETPAPEPDPVEETPEPATETPAPEPDPVEETPEPATETPAPEPTTSGSYAEPVDGACPEGFPVKVKLSSGIYHEPGGTHYGRVKPDRCYTSAAAAEADGFRSSRS